MPRRKSRFLRLVGRRIFSIMGWRFEGEAPNLSQFVIIGAPHTSNWDFVVGMAAGLALNLYFYWFGKHTIFRWPFRRILRGLGGIPVDRSKSGGLVEHAVASFRDRPSFVLALAPEGTRKKVARWRTGFHHIARAAGVPIVMAYFDFERKVVGLGPAFYPTADLESDLAEIHTFYERFKGKRPDQF